jgi:glycosyltransferase involved in cell wall biosynthesis
MVKNEEHDLAEWLAFHHIIGFDACVVFDHESTDGTDRVLAKAARVQDVRVIRWRSKQPDAQTTAYRECLRRFKRHFDWIAFLDSDEFLIPKGEPTVRPMLERLSRHSQIAINEAFFGTSGHDRFPLGLVLESFRRRAENGFDPNNLVKPIVRPSHVRRVVNPHAFEVSGTTVTPSGQPAEWTDTFGKLKSPPDYARCQVNHYFLRSRQHWENKLRRSYPNPNDARAPAHFAWYDRNEIEDGSADPYIEATRRQRDRILAARTGGSLLSRFFPATVARRLAVRKAEKRQW